MGSVAGRSSRTASIPRTNQPLGVDEDAILAILARARLPLTVHDASRLRSPVSDVTLGALCWNQYADWPSLLAAGQRADRLGFDTLWTWDL